MANITQLLTEHIDIWTAADTEKKSGRGRASGNAGSVYGVKKLRELILELAVRGKLVPQNPNDEPASELLKRIQAEKAKLIAEGKLKKEKPLAPICEDEKPFELPNGWAYSSLGDVVEIIRGITFPGSEKTKVPEKGRVACLRTTNVQDQIEWDDLLYIREEFVAREDQILMPSDIVMSMANSRELVGKVALVGKEIHQKTSFGGFLGVLRPFMIEPRFVMALLRTPHTREALIDSASQTTNIANISLAKLRPLFFAIPSLAEQHRIVAKVDELMALCDQLENQHLNAAEARETLVSELLATLTQNQNAADFNANWQRIYAHFDVLFTTEASIDALKQTLLQLAVMGKLVPQDPNDEPASELLKRIQAEKAKLIAEGKLKKEKPLAPISEDEKPFELPIGWEWVRLGSITSIRGGKRVSNGYVFLTQPTPYIYIRVSDMKNGSIDDSDLRYIDYEMRMKINSYIITKDDIYMTIVGATIGKCGLVPDEFDQMNLTENAARLTPIADINKIYLFECLDSTTSQIQFVDSTKQVGVQKMALNKLASTLIPLPPIFEQHRIVAKVDALMALCDQLKTRIQQANQQQQVIADALVTQAVA